VLEYEQYFDKRAPQNVYTELMDLRQRVDLLEKERMLLGGPSGIPPHPPTDVRAPIQFIPTGHGGAPVAGVSLHHPPPSFPAKSEAQ
jgi:hypothetical protein